MKFTLDWLKDHLDTSATLDEILEKLTAIGLEVEGVEDRARLLAPFTVAYIKDAVQHPNADRLRVCTVDTGSETLQIVCGAPNARAGIKVVLSRPGDYIPGLDKTLGKSAIRGVDSQGMLCAADELGLGSDHSGIMELPEDTKLGAKLLDVMPVGDVIIEVNLTPNRGDCAGVRGIARDLAATGLGTLKPLEMGATKSSFDNPYKVELADTKACPAFALRLVKGVKNGPSPAWLRRRLEAIGVKPISILVDITNYLTFDQARPLHVFDAAKVSGTTLTVRPAKDGETIEALNNKNYTLDNSITVIADGKAVESLGGVMGGLHSGCGDDTTDVLIECALFSEDAVATTGRKLQINTDARYRFERGVDTQSVLPGIEQATRLVLELCGGEASTIFMAGEVPSTQTVVHYHPERLLALTGVSVDNKTQKQILENIGCKVAEHHGHFDVTVPTWRRDIRIEEDLVEDVLRLTGYDNIPPTALPHTGTVVALNPAQRRNQTARRIAAGRDLLEVVSWSFMAREHAALFDQINPRLTLANPISADLSQMRPSIVGNLVQMAARNTARGFADNALFEVGPVYRDIGLKGQETVATLLRAGAALPRHWQGQPRAADVFDIKADLAALLAQFGLSIDNVPLTAEAPGYYHPGRSFTLRLGPNVIAYAGEIHPSVAKELGLEDVRAVACELFLDRLPLPKKTGAAKPLLKLPPLQPVTRDFAFLIDREAAADVLVKAIRKADKDAITKVDLFDLYEGNKLPEGQKSIAISVTLQPQGQTAFTDKDLEALSEKIVGAATKAGASLR